jgi:hypothetical protein
MQHVQHRERRRRKGYKGACADWAAAEGHELRDRPYVCLSNLGSEFVPFCPSQAVWSATEVLGNVAATAATIRGGSTKGKVPEVEVPPERTALSPDEALHALVSRFILVLTA